MANQYIRVDLPSCVVFLTPSEINKLLQSDLKLFSEALKRGKGISRYEQQKSREQAKWANEGYV